MKKQLGDNRQAMLAFQDKYKIRAPVRSGALRPNPNLLTAGSVSGRRVAKGKLCNDRQVAAQRCITAQ